MSLKRAVNKQDEMNKTNTDLLEKPRQGLGLGWARDPLQTNVAAAGRACACEWGKTRRLRVCTASAGGRKESAGPK